MKYLAALSRTHAFALQREKIVPTISLETLGSQKTQRESSAPGEKRWLQSELTARSRNVDDGDWKKHADRLSVHFHFASECLTESAA